MYFKLLLLILAFLTNISFTKEKGIYLPLFGYASSAAPNINFNLHGLQIGLIGYSFSNDFRIELTGLGSLEKIPIIVTSSLADAVEKYETHSRPPIEMSGAIHAPEVLRSNAALQTPLQSPTPPRISLFSTHEKWKKQPQLGTPTKIPPSVSSGSRVDLYGNPWDTEAPVPSSPQPMSPLTNPEHANNNLTKPQNNPETLLDTTEFTTANTHSTPPAQQDRTIPTDIPQGHNTEQTLLKKVGWGGGTLAVKCTLLHLHPDFNIYWGPNTTLLYPFYTKVSSQHSDLMNHCLGTLVKIGLTIGCRWVIYPKFAVDISLTDTLKTWGAGPTEATEIVSGTYDWKRKGSGFFHNEKKAFKVSLHWYPE